MKCIKHTSPMRRATMLLLMLLTVCTAWAQEQPVSKSISDVTVHDIGKVVCTDGSVYATMDDAGSDNKYPVAMIAYVGNDSFLAIAFEDICLPIEGTQYWKGSFQWAEAAGAVTTWAAEGKAVTGCAWKVPTIQEWQMMLIGCGAEGTVSDNPSSDALTFTGLNKKLYAVSQYAKLSNWYWSATEF